MSQFGTLSSIRLDDPASWQDQLFLTFDFDWARDEVLADTIDLVEQSGVAATWFVTHSTNLLRRLRENPLFELGIHPNFNPLLAGDSSARGKNASGIVRDLLELVPEARAVRSHSLAQSTPLANLFRQAGLVFECNDLIHFDSGIQLRPWLHWSGMVKIPFFWEDDVHFTCQWDCTMSQLKAMPGLKAFAFHPLHVFLNTDTVLRYEKAKKTSGDIAELRSLGNPGQGIRTILQELLRC